jgi:hypothetical protein
MDHSAARTGGHRSEAACSPEVGLGPLLSSEARPARVGCGEGRTVKPARRSPGLARRRGGRAAMASRRRQWSSEVAMFDLREEGRRRGMSAARVGGRPPPFIGPEGGGGADGFNGRP